MAMKVAAGCVRLLSLTKCGDTSPVQICRYSKKAVVYSKKLIYCDYGDPTEVVKMVEDKLSAPQNNEILVEMIGAPINPADINTIQGVYPKKPLLPAVGGNEGVGRVSAVGNDVKDLKPGDLVIPNEIGLGTWRSLGIWDATKWMKVPSDLGIAEAATLTVNPLTAYRMLKDFVNLKPGDTVIQNGANSACGQYVLQLCNAWNLISVNVVRDRPNIEVLKNSLTKLGASHVLTEEELRSTSLFKNGGIKAPKLALNCVGGQSGMEILRKLAFRGVHVTYGGMSRNPVTAPTSALIFKDISLHGFWMTRWTEENFNSPKRQEMFNEVIGLMLDGKVKAPAHKMLPFQDFQNALSMKEFAGQKFILTFCAQS